MVLFSFTRSYFRKIAPFAVLLLVLVLLSAVHGLFFAWPGVALILRVYVYAFAFLLIYSVQASRREQYRASYLRTYGELRGYTAFVLETGMLPYLFIYLSLLLFALASQISSTDWPEGTFLAFAEGRLANLVFYCMLLQLAMKLQRNPILAAMIFTGGILGFFWIDHAAKELIPYGYGDSIYKSVKLVLFFFFALWDFRLSLRRTIFHLLAALGISAVLYPATLGFMYAEYRLEAKPDVRRRAGLMLARTGFPGPLSYLAVDAYLRRDQRALLQLDPVFRAHDRDIPLSRREWEDMLFAGNPADADAIAGLMLEREVVADWRKMADYASLRRDAGGMTVHANYATLAARMISGNERAFILRLDSANRDFLLWGMQILGLSRSEESILFLVKKLTNVDPSVSTMAYAALRNIAGRDPAREMNLNHNSPEVIRFFKERYLYRGKDD